MSEADPWAIIASQRQMAVEWGKRADEAMKAKQFLDAQQHLRRANELVLSALKLEQSLTTA